MVAKVVLGAMVVAVVGPVGVAEAGPSTAALPSNCSQAGTTVTCVFSYTGAEQTFVVPVGPSELTMDLRGASGGRGGDGRGGLGGVASQSLSIGAGSDSDERIYAGQTLYVEVGGAGSDYSGPGGFNGGGTGATSGYGGGGGGASDIRTLSRTTALTVSDTRLIVAGGGGGGGNCSNLTGRSDGGGAGQPGLAPCDRGAVPGGGGTSTGGSATPPATAGELGQGGNASGSAGGGGGGFYGGGGGLGGGSFVSAGGGGGSSWTVEADGTTGPAAAAGDGAVTISYALTAQQITFPALSGDARVGTTVVLVATGGGSGQPVSFSLDPSTTNDACVVSGDPGSQTVSFRHVGDCVIAADQAGDGDHAAATTVTRTIPVLAGAQSITFTTTAPTAAPVAGTYRPAAAGGDSGAEVVFSIDPSTTNNACSITGTPGGPEGQVVSFDRAGVCVVAADQAGSTDYAAAPSMTQSITVTVAPSSVGVTFASGQVVYGQPAEATVVADRAGSVQLLVDGSSTGPAVSVSQDRPVTLTVTAPGGAPVAPGAHSVEVVLTPADTDRYAGSRASASLAVSPAATTTRLRVSTEALIATVTPERSMAPGAAAPSGIVTFSLNGEPVGQAPLTAAAAGGATAVLPRAIPAGKASAVSAAYAGDQRFTGSSASASRDSPAITATVVTKKSSRGRKGPDWYRSPVTVRFRCTTTTAPLVRACPSPVTLRHDGAGRAVTRTITATDGGTDTVTVSGINIDRAAPRVDVAGIRNGESYYGAQPRPSCRATDRLSGVARCSVSTRRATSVDGTNRAVRYRAVATDKAGNRTVVRGGYTVHMSYLEGAKLARGRFLVAAGESYRLVVTDSSVRPTYYLAELAPRRPHARGMAMYPAGPRQWALTIRIDEGMSGRDWNLGIETGGKMTSLRLRVRG
jgi:hypothetical protein